MLILTPAQHCSTKKAQSDHLVVFRAISRLLPTHLSTAFIPASPRVPALKSGFLGSKRRMEAIAQDPLPLSRHGVK